jgi:Domain of unknown function (DUF1840)
MGIVVFRSKAAGEFYMLSENAQAVLNALGRPLTERGVIPAAQVPEALRKLQAVVDQAQSPPPEDEDDPPPAMGRQVGFAQRAFPLLEMLRAAEKRQADVTWGV